MIKNSIYSLIRGTTLLVIAGALCCACMSERYRTDRKNKLSAHAEKSDNYLQNQATEFTQDNIRKKDINQKRAMKRNNKEQERLNELNSRSSKVKKSGRKTGTFNIY